MITTGAVIITGETARKENSEGVLQELAAFAGDFVVAVAGPDLEAIFAAQGAGTLAFSKNTTKKLININIGGGTSNYAVIQNGIILDTFALNIGGRLIRINAEGQIEYISPKIQSLISQLDLPLEQNYKVNLEDLQQLTYRFASMIGECVGIEPLQPETINLFINHQNQGIIPEEIFFSGGVAEFIYSLENITTLQEVSQFGDIGPLLGQTIRNYFQDHHVNIREPQEKIQATVIGAGSYSIQLSGTTIIYEETILPLKNVPMVHIFENETEDIQIIETRIEQNLVLYPDQMFGIGFHGPECPSYKEIQTIAKQITIGFQSRSEPIIVIVEHDFAKALGQTIQYIICNSKPVICLDRIQIQNGDYIDIGKPILGVLPVIIKTIFFSR